MTYIQYLQNKARVPEKVHHLLQPVGNRMESSSSCQPEYRQTAGNFYPYTKYPFSALAGTAGSKCSPPLHPLSRYQQPNPEIEKGTTARISTERNRADRA